MKPAAGIRTLKSWLLHLVAIVKKTDTVNFLGNSLRTLLSKV